jgi:hypothetical protein
MANAEFWRKLKDEFTELAKQEYSVVRDAGDGRRLRAQGDYSSGGGGGIGCWFVNDSFSADFRASFDETAVCAGHALNPPPGANPLEFWLHSLFQFLLEIDETREDRGHLVVGDKEHGGIVRDLCAASAMYCSILATRARDFVRRFQEPGAIEGVRIRARQMLAEGATHQQVCQRLKDAPRPPRVEWRHLSWDKAYQYERYRGAVCKWLSKNCRP